MRCLVRFFRDPGIFAWAIRVWTWSDYNHCDLAVVSPGSSGSVVVYTARTGHGVEQFPAATPCAVALEIPLDLPDGPNALGLARSELGCAYDWTGIWLAQVFPFRREHPDRWFCSEYVAALLRAGGLRVPGRNCDYSPADVLRLARRLSS